MLTPTTKSYAIYLVVVMVLGFELFYQPSYTSVEVGDIREQAIVAAREGRYTQALDDLEILYRADPKHAGVTADFISVLFWAGETKRALEIASSADLSVAPGYLYPTLGQLCLEQNSPDGCIPLFEQARTHYSKRPELLLTLIANLSTRFSPMVTPYSDSVISQFPESEFVVSIAMEKLKATTDQKDGVLLSAYEVKQRDKRKKKLQKLDADNYLYRTQGRYQDQSRVLEKLAVLSHAPGPYLRSLKYALLAQENDSNKLRLGNKFKGLAHRFKYTPFYQESIALYLRDGETFKARRLLDSLPNSVLSADLLEALAYQLRQKGLIDDALDYYQKGAANYPDRSVFIAGQVLCLVDLAEYSKGLSLVHKKDHQFKDDQDFILAKTYLFQRKGDVFSLQKNYQQLSDLSPQDSQKYADWVMSIAEVGAPMLAFDKAKENADAFTPEQWQSLYADRAAIAVRWARLPDNPSSSGRGERNVRVNRAVDYARQSLAFTQENRAADTVAIRRARTDLVVALYYQGDMKKVVEEYKALNRPADQLPGYLNIVAGQAFLAMKNPTKASSILSMAVKQAPDDQDAATALYYAYQESESFEKAQRFAEQRLKGQAPWRQRSKAQPAQANYQVSASAQMLAMGKASAGDLSSAQSDLQALLKLAPFNHAIKLDLATVYRWRGWLQKAQSEYDQLDSMIPTSKALAAAKYFQSIGLHDFSNAKQKRENFIGLYSSGRDSVAINENWAQHQKWQLVSNASLALNSANTFGEQEWSWDTRLYSPPIIDQHYRMFAHNYNAAATFDEGRGQLNRVGVGIEKRQPYFNWSLELSGNIAEQTNPGLTLSADGFVTDFWHWNALIQSYSVDAPLRAFHNNIDGYSMALGGGYRWHESRRLDMGLSWLELSDGNTRQQLDLSLTQNIMRKPKHKVDLVGSFYASKNRLTNVAYFSPEHDVSINFSGEYEGVLNRHYDFWWKHRVSIGSGLYIERGESVAPLGNINYEHLWQMGVDFTVYYGLSHGYRVYSGDGESQSRLFAGIDWRF